MKVLFAAILLFGSLSVAGEAEDNLAQMKAWRTDYNKRCPAPKSAQCIKEFSDHVDKEEATYNQYVLRQEVQNLKKEVNELKAETPTPDTVQIPKSHVQTCTTIVDDGVTKTMDCY